MPVMMRARGQGLALCRSVLLVLAAISFVHVADARLRLWFRTYDEHGNLSVEDYTLEAEEGGGAIPTRTVRLDHMATGIEYWMEGGGQITLRRIEANGADRDVARYDRAVGIETVGNLRFNVIDYGAAAERKYMAMLRFTYLFCRPLHVPAQQSELLLVHLGSPSKYSYRL